MRRRLAAVAPAIAGAILVAGGGASLAASTNTPTVIVIDKMAFGPAPSDLRVGQTVVWENRDIFEHTATDRGGGFDVTLPPGAKARVTLARPGRIVVYCRYHPGMTMTLSVAKSPSGEYATSGIGDGPGPVDEPSR